MCSDQSPWAVNDNLAYGFAAVTAANPTCCTCYKLTFTTTSIKGKTMIVQATNTGNDVSGTQFDLAVSLELVSLLPIWTPSSLYLLPPRNEDAT